MPSASRPAAGPRSGPTAGDPGGRPGHQRPMRSVGLQLALVPDQKLIKKFGKIFYVLSCVFSSITYTRDAHVHPALRGKHI